MRQTLGARINVFHFFFFQAQGALAWYATYVTGRMAQSWFSRGKSWGSGGPRETARAILDSVDRDSVIQSARDDILNRLKGR